MNKGKRNKRNDDNKIIDDNVGIYANGDVPNIATHLGFRLLYTIVAWCVLAKGLSTNAFIVSACLFTMPIFLDCIKYSATNKLRQQIMYIEVIISTFWMLIFVLGMFNVFTIVELNNELVLSIADDFIGLNNYVIPVRIVWLGMLSLVFITAMDWLCQFIGLNKR